MKTLILEVRSLEETLADAAGAMRHGRGEPHDRISFDTPELLWKVLTAKRWEILKALCGASPISIRESARRVGRDVKAVHGDVMALLEAGILHRVPDGRIEFPYEAVKVEFLLSAA
jgi:predicted transcriptional regulator